MGSTTRATIMHVNIYKLSRNVGLLQRNRNVDLLSAVHCVNVNTYNVFELVMN